MGVLEYLSSPATSLGVIFRLSPGQLFRGGKSQPSG